MIRAALLLLCLAAPLWADPAEEAARLADVAGPGAVVAIWTPEGQVIEVAGTRQRGGDPVQPGDAWHIGSLTKSMTATLAARLVEQGAITWGTPVDALLPDAGAAWADVTLTELLHHRSGMAANLPRWRAALRPGRAAYLAHMLASTPAGPRGEFLYSNAGYVVAGAMLEAAGGADYETLLARHVFAPLGMENVGFGAPADIWGHDPDPVAPGWRADNLPAMSAAGRVHLPPEAMLRYLAAHASQDVGFLPDAAWDMLHEPEGDYAMGWAVGEGGLTHAGSNTLWFARMWIAEGRAVFVAVNSGAEAAQQATAQSLARVSAPPARPEDPPPE